MNAAEAIVKILEIEGIDSVFGCPGGAIMPLYEALRTSNIKHYLVRNEQGAAHAASGYARESMGVGVCIATSGPGATNLITGIATAYMDSIPMIAITGQVRKDYIGKDVFQEADIFGSTEPFTKHNFLVTKAEDIPEIMAKALLIATTGRKGPVLIDIPKDVLLTPIEFKHINEVQIRGYNPTVKGHTGQIKRIIKRLNAAQNPVIIAGGGVIASGARKELIDLANARKIPVVNTLMGVSSFPMDSPYYVGIIGYHGDDICEKVLQQADLLLVIGARMTDRATKNFSLIKPDVNVIHIDIDPSEIGKNIAYEIPVVGDARIILEDINQKISPYEGPYWIEAIISEEPSSVEPSASDDYGINPWSFLHRLTDRLNADAIITADVGQNQIWAAKHISYDGNRKYLTSGGLGTMGYSLPAAIGAKLASPDKTVIAIMGDGGIQMLLGELGTLAETNEKVIVVILNNNLLGMVKELQDNAYGKRGRFGVQYSIRPDFIKIGEGYGLPGRAITQNDEITSALDEAFNCATSFIINCAIDPEIDSI